MSGPKKSGRSRQLLESAECYLLRTKDAPWPISLVVKEFMHPISYVLSGVEFFAKNWAKVLVYPPVFMLLALFVSNQFNLVPAQSNAITTIACIIGISVVFFAVPSTFAHSGLSDRDVEFLADQIEERISGEHELQAVRANLELLEETADGRVRAMKLALATIWGAILFSCSQAIGILTKILESNQFGDLISGSLTFIILAGFFAILSLLAITGYQRANDMLFRGLRFACNQVAVRLCAQQSTKDTTCL